MWILEAYLHKHNIVWDIYEHEPVFTIEEAEKHCSHIPWLPGKNLFLRDAKKRRYFLIIVAGVKKVHLMELCEKLWEKKISFASPEDLFEKLSITPGSVSPFCLIHESAKDVEVYIDSDILHAEIVNFHPLRNNAALVLTQEMFQKYLQSLHREIHHITI